MTVRVRVGAHAWASGNVRRCKQSRVVPGMVMLNWACTVPAYTRRGRVGWIIMRQPADVSLVVSCRSRLAPL
eukprot:12410697-Karenia_brevis.AAC.1